MIPIAVPFNPGFEGPLDSREIVKTLGDLEVLRLSSKSYPLMKVSCLSNGYTYQLSNDKTEWVLFTAVGPKGDAATVGIHSVETVAATAPAEVINMGNSNNANFKFKIPKGAVPTITIGTVTEVSAGQGQISLTATPNGVAINMSIPRGIDSDLNSISSYPVLNTGDKRVLHAINELLARIVALEG